MQNLLIVACGIALGLLGISQEIPHKVNGSSGNTQQSQADKRGTKEAPLVVETHPAYTEQEATEHSSEIRERKSVNRWNIGLTLSIAICAALQVVGIIFQIYIYKRQTRIMHATTKIILRQARTMATQAKDFREASITQNEISERSVLAAEQSASASLRSIAALEKLERPFLMIEVRGQVQDAVWAINKGKVPAQIVWYNNAPMFIFRNYEEIAEMHGKDYDYGFGHGAGEMFNVPWLAPGEEMVIARFAWQINEVSEEVTRQFHNGNKFALFLSTVRYRGMLSDKVFESRWCFLWFGKENGGLKLNGSPYGYNSYT